VARPYHVEQLRANRGDAFEEVGPRAGFAAAAAAKRGAQVDHRGGTRRVQLGGVGWRKDEVGGAPQ
jgi:ribosomal protein L13E